MWRGAGTTVLLLSAGLLATDSGAAAGAPGEPQAQSISFMTVRDWQRSSDADKIMLSSDFMRVFCISPTMAPKRLADCLDSQPGMDPLFERAIDCSKRIGEAD